MQPIADQITAWIAGFKAEQAAALTALRQQLIRLVPGAIETIDWGMPSLRINNVLLLSYQGFSKHNSIFAGPEVAAQLGSVLGDRVVTKGTIHFGRTEHLKPALLKQIVRARIQIINESYPKASGAYLSFYDNGHLKASGKYRDGEMTGHWRFYRRDGSLMREGKLKSGEPVGEWVTHARDSAS